MRVPGQKFFVPPNIAGMARSYNCQHGLRERLIVAIKNFVLWWCAAGLFHRRKHTGDFIRYLTFGCQPDPATLHHCGDHHRYQRGH